MLKISGREGSQTTYLASGNAPQFNNVQAALSGPQVMTIFYTDTHKVNGYSTTSLSVNGDTRPSTSLSAAAGHPQQFAG